ncbi:MAG: stage II sporulation protein R [Ruminococcus sp.]|nr:stage II sporulation protein R [Ruminococcus sp.]
MKKNIILFGGLVLAVIISNIGSFVSDGKALDELRGSVLRLHILAESDSEYDQNLKIKVRDRLLESDIFDGAESLEEAEKLAEEKLPEIIDIAEETLRKNGCFVPVTAEITDMDFDERVYGNITMPSGNYRALRIKIGSAEGHNWWCVMYPPLCIPSACEIEENEDAEEVFFSEKEIDIMNNPKKYKVRFAIWDKLKSVFG